MKYKCPCWNQYTYNFKPNGSFDICPVCFWKDDLVQNNNQHYEGEANKISLLEVRQNYLTFGASEAIFLKRVRKPTESELNTKK